MRRHYIGLGLAGAVIFLALFSGTALLYAAGYSAGIASLPVTIPLLLAAGPAGYRFARSTDELLNMPEDVTSGQQAGYYMTWMLDGLDLALLIYGGHRALNPRFPANDGAVPGTERDVVLEPLTSIDRYGYPTGHYVSPAGTPMNQRALPWNANLSMYKRYRVLKSLDAKESIIADAFGDPGHGTQFKFNKNIQQLINEGYLEEIY